MKIKPISLFTGFFVSFLVVGCSQSPPVSNSPKVQETKVVEEVKKEIPLVKGVDLNYEYQIIQERVVWPGIPENAKVVIEVFGYPCIHCYNLHKDLSKNPVPSEGWVWLRVPATFGGGWDLFAQLYFTGQRLGVSEEVHGKVFSSFHDKKVFQQADQDKIFEEYAKLSGIEVEKLKLAFESASVQEDMEKAKKMLSSAKINGTPALIVNGHYQVLNQPKFEETRQILIDLMEKAPNKFD